MAIFSDKTVVCTPAVFLPWLRKRLEDAGVTFKRVNIRSLSDLKALGHDVLVNATGAGPFHLKDVQDKKVQHVRGQTVLVKTDYDRVMIRTGKDYTYCIPRLDGTAIVGGIKQYGNKCASYIYFFCQLPSHTETTTLTRRLYIGRQEWIRNYERMYVVI